MSAPAPGMTPANAFNCQPASGQCAVVADGFQRVLGATRREAAAPQRPEQKGLCRRKHPLIEAHAHDQDMLGGIHAVSPATGFNNLAFRIVVRKSLSTAANPLPAIDWRATSTRSTGAARSC